MREEINELLKAGKSPKEIKAVLGVSGAAIRDCADALGMPHFRRGREATGHSPEVADKVDMARRLKIAGLSYAAIAGEIGVSRQRAQQYLRIRLPKERNKQRCEQCNKVTKVLHCHHVSYETNEFQLLCLRCHSIAHGCGEGVRAKRKRSGKPMPQGDVRDFLSRSGKAGIAKRWKGTTKAERVKAVQAAVAAHKAIAAKRNGKGGG